jgi:hypothetical protein
MLPGGDQLNDKPKPRIVRIDVERRGRFIPLRRPTRLADRSRRQPG